MKQAPERVRIQFPSFPLLGNGKLGNCRKTVQSTALRVSHGVLAIDGGDASCVPECQGEKGGEGLE